MGARYHFVTSFNVHSPREAVWRVLEDAEAWPDWWRWLERIELIREGDNKGIGTIIRSRVTTPLRYRLTYDGTTRRSNPPDLIEFDATGDLVGRGQFRLHETGGSHTKVVFTWMVETPKWWMNAVAPIARPMFTWNHHRLMEDFAIGIGSVLGVPVTGVENRRLRPDQTGYGVFPAEPG